MKKIILQVNTTNNTLPHQRIPAIDAEGYCCSELYEHQCGIPFSNKNSILHNKLLSPIKKKSQHIVPNTHETSSYQFKCSLKVTKAKM